MDLTQLPMISVFLVLLWLTLACRSVVMLSEVLFLIPFNDICYVFKSVYYTVVSREENWQKSKMKITVPRFILNACLVFCSQIVTE